MFTSILGIPETNTDEHIPTSSRPWVWVGFLFAGAFFVIEILWVILGLDESSVNLFLTLIMLAGWIYWLVCVHRIHKILAELTWNRYPISASEAAGKHFIPFYNFVWMFKWPAELSSYINSRGRVSIINGYGIGGMILLSLVLRAVDGAFGMAFLFGVTMYVSARVAKHVKTLQGVTPDQLPPLPDPRIFSRPLEGSTAPAQGVVEESGVG